MSPFPPLGPPMTGVTCNRNMPDGSPCGALAEWHIIWDSTITHSMCCTAHFDDARALWAFYAAHNRMRACNRPGAVFVPEHNICVHPDEVEPGAVVAVEALT